MGLSKAEVFNVDVKIGRWGKSLAFRIPADLVEATGFAEGDMVAMEYRDGDILLHRSNHARLADARAAATELVRLARGRSLGGTAIRDLIDDGRR